VFRTKSRTERTADTVRDQGGAVLERVGPSVEHAREEVVHAAEVARDEVSHAAEVASEWARPRLEAAVDWASPRAHATKDWAAPRLEKGWERGRDAAAPHVSAAAHKVAPHVDATRERLLEDLLPRVAATITAAGASGAASAELARHRSEDALAVLRGEAVAKRPRRKRKGLLVVLLLLAAAGGAAFGVLRKQSHDADPWESGAHVPTATPPTGPVGDAQSSTRSADAVAPPETTNPPATPGDGERPADGS
jgi:hypothetical protein